MTFVSNLLVFLSERKNSIKTKLITIKAYTGGAGNYFFIKATQEYNAEFDMGHYNYCITDKDSNIIYVSQSTGGPPRGKIDKKFLKEQLENFGKQYKHHQSVLAKEKKQW